MNMNANYIYDIFETTNKHGCPDLYIGLAMLKAEKPIPEGMNDKGIRAFLADHYEELVAAYRCKDREIFSKTVEKLTAEDTEAEGYAYYEECKELVKAKKAQYGAEV